MATFIQAASEIILKAFFNSWLKDARITLTKSGVYPNHIIELCLKDIRSTLYWIYSAEDREAMSHENQNFIDDLSKQKKLDEAYDQYAKDDEECRIEQKEGMLKNKNQPIVRLLRLLKKEK